MSDDLVERVARTACASVNSADTWDETGTDVHEMVWFPIARAAIAVCMEEAAKVAENYDGPGMESVPDATWGDAQATKDDIAYYIRALVKET